MDSNRRFLRHQGRLCGHEGLILECLLDQLDDWTARQRGDAFPFLLQFFGEPASGLADLLDVAPGLVAGGQQVFDLGVRGRVKLAQGISSQPGVVGVEDHLWILLSWIQARASTG